MNLTHQFRRTATVVAGAVIGLAAAMVLTVPASAHTGELTAASARTATGWTATWNLTTSDTDGHEGRAQQRRSRRRLHAGPPGTGGSPKLAKLTDGATVTGDTTVSVTLTLSRVATRATLNLTLTWQVGDDTHTKTLRAQAEAPAHCGWPPPDEPSRLSTTVDCATMTITPANPQSAKDGVTLRLRTSEGEQRTLVAAEASKVRPSTSTVHTRHALRSDGALARVVRCRLLGPYVVWFTGATLCGSRASLSAVSLASFSAG